MTNSLSKSLPLTISCYEYFHPWTKLCVNSTIGQLFYSSGNSFKVYLNLYMLSLLLHGRIPTILDLKQTFFNIIRSSGFLVTNTCGYTTLVCVFRNLLGTFYYWTIAWAPAFVASFASISIERPSRRPFLSLYVANLATETIWRMGVARNLVQPIQYGETLIFGFSASILLYIYERGLHKTIVKDSSFSIIKFVVGGDEKFKKINNSSSIRDNNDDDDKIIIQNNNQQPSNSNNDSSNENINDDGDFDVFADANDGENEININEQQQQEILEEERKLQSGQQSKSKCYDNDNTNNLSDFKLRKNEKKTIKNYYINSLNKFKIISELIQIYGKYLNLIKTMPKHKSCPHSNSCAYNAICGGIKLFGTGIGLQVGLKLALQIKNILRFKLKFRKTILNPETLKLGLFLGGFSFLYKTLSCSFRHLFGKDDPLFAIPAGLISSIAFTEYPDVTVALYVMWKMLQITYNMGINTGYLPKVPGFTEFLYCASTATLMHAAALEAETLRPNYWKFIVSTSGGLLCYHNRRPFDILGLNSEQQAMNIKKLTNTDKLPLSPLIKNPLITVNFRK